MKAALIGLFALGAAACSSMQVESGKDPQANFSKYHTFAWAPAAQKAPGQQNDSLLDQTVRDSVEKELAKKGIRLTTGTPDLLVTYVGVARNAVSYGPAPMPGYSPYYYYNGYDYAYRVGSLTLQFIDSTTQRVVWQGTASDVISDAGASQKQVAEAVQKLVDEYPKA